MTAHAYVTLPRRFLGLLVAQKPPEPVPTVRDIERWLRQWGTQWGDDLDARDEAARRLLWALWLVRTGRCNDER